MRCTRSMLAVVPLLVSCGGGTGSSHDSVSGVDTRGVILSVDGATANLADVTVGAPDADVWVPCDDQGRFDLGRLPAEETTIVFSPGDRPAIEVLADLRACAGVHIELAIDGDRISRMDMEHCGAQNGIATVADMGDMDGARWTDGMHGMDEMMDSGGMAGPGSATMHQDDTGHMSLAVEVPGFDPGASVEVVLVAESGDRVTLGVVTADADGLVRAAWDASGGGPLPFDATHMHDLAGVAVEVRDADTGELLYAGTLPEVGLLHGTC